MPALTLGFFRVVTEDMSPSPFSITDDDFFCMKVLFDNGITSSFRQNRFPELGCTGHAGDQEVLAAGTGQFSPFMDRIHPRIREQTIPGLASSRVNPSGYGRWWYLRETPSTNHPRAPGPFLGMTVLSERIIPIIFVING